MQWSDPQRAHSIVVILKIQPDLFSVRSLLVESNTVAVFKFQFLQLHLDHQVGSAFLLRQVQFDVGQTHVLFQTARVERVGRAVARLTAVIAVGEQILCIATVVRGVEFLKYSFVIAQLHLLVTVVIQMNAGEVQGGTDGFVVLVVRLVCSLRSVDHFLRILLVAFLYHCGLLFELYLINSRWREREREREKN